MRTYTHAELDRIARESARRRRRIRETGRLSRVQIEVLTMLVNSPRETSKKTTNSWVSGASVEALRLLGYCDARYDSDVVGRVAEITQAGRQALERVRS